MLQFRGPPRFKAQQFLFKAKQHKVTDNRVLTSREDLETVLRKDKVQCSGGAALTVKEETCPENSRGREAVEQSAAPTEAGRTEGLVRRGSKSGGVKCEDISDLR